jgi:hypothetical protein
MQATALPPDAAAPAETWRWWEGRRLRYNIGLAVAGAAAWTLFALQAVGFGASAFGEPFPITLSMTLGQGLIWLVIMGVANVLYLLGPISEPLLRPTDVGAYRRRMFGLGFWGSVALPFLFPAAMLVNLLALARL